MHMHMRMQCERIKNNMRMQCECNAKNMQSKVKKIKVK